MKLYILVKDETEGKLPVIETKSPLKDTVTHIILALNECGRGPREWSIQLTISVSTAIDLSSEE